MNRNSYQSYSGTYYNGGANKTASSGLGGTNAQRSPLYPIGPTLTQPEFKPIQRGTSPYLSRQGLMPPSYDQRHRHQTATGFNQTAGENHFDTTKINYEDR